MMFHWWYTWHVASLDDMALFAAVAAHGGVRGGARALGVPGATASRRLAALERALGIKLAARAAGRFQLTDAGRDYHEECQRLVALAERANARARAGSSEPRGVLRLTASNVVGEEMLPPIVDAYLARYPDVSVELVLSTARIDLVHAGIDLAIRGGALDDSDELVAQPLGHSVTGLYASPRYLRARGEPKRPDDLATHECIRVLPNRDHWALVDRGVETKVAITGRLVVDGFRVAREAAIRGLGVVRLAASFAEAAVDARKLVPILRPHWVRTPMWALYPGGRYAPARVKKMLELLKSDFRA